MGNSVVHFTKEREAPQEAACFVKAAKKRVAVVSDDRVATLYANPLMEALRNEGVVADLFTFPSGEEYKSRSSKESVEDCMFSAGLSKDALLIAMGGGVALDLAGFVAATYCRGIPLLMIPTTLLAMVDAAHGGKNGLNTPFGKNLIGSYLLPQKIFIDPHYLQSEPLFQIASGLAEMLKAALALKQDLFFQLHKISIAFSEDVLPAIVTHIPAAVKLKELVVKADFKDTGMRHLLNFGHTIGHALESAFEYTMPHGMAVLIGMLIESRISRRMDILPAGDLEIVEEAIFPLLSVYGKSLKGVNFDGVRRALLLDKKSSQNHVKMVLLKAIGESLVIDDRYSHPVELPRIEEELEIVFKNFWELQPAS